MRRPQPRPLRAAPTEIRPIDRERVVLIGFMGAGKTSVGRLVAARLKWTFIDSDHEVVRRAGLSVREIFERDGEAGFRRLERDAVTAAIARPRIVLALGGGAVESPEVRRRVWGDGFVIYLAASADVLERRLSAGESTGTRPLLDGGFPAALLRAREPHYRNAHRTVVTTGRNVDAVAEEIVATLAPPRSER